jgi:hypothetical protein
MNRSSRFRERQEILFFSPQSPYQRWGSPFLFKENMRFFPRSQSDVKREPKVSIRGAIPTLHPKSSWRSAYAQGLRLTMTLIAYKIIHHAWGLTIK